MISPVDLSVLGVLVLVTALAPALMLRKERSTWGRAEALFWSAALLFIAATRMLDITISGELLFGIGFVARGAMFAGLVLARGGDGLKWSASRAGVATGIAYLLLIPHVLQWPIDGDEPYFLLLTESIVRDGDLDLANQYANLNLSDTGRIDLKPQLGDPTGEDGEMYSRHEPFFPVLLIPGSVIGGRYGAAVTVALFGALLVASFLRLAEERGHAEASWSLTWPAIALGPPVLFYATRLWTEVPGALALSEALRALEARRWRRFAIWLLLLSLLQIRFGLLAIGILAVAVVRERPRPRIVILAAGLLMIPFLALRGATGSFLGVHQIFELLPTSPTLYLRGFAGLVLDAQAGMLFQAPLWLLGCAGLLRKDDRTRLAPLWIAAVPYLLLLAPRSEWHGGWSPPLRYLVVLSPIVALGIERARLWLPRSLQILAGLWTVGIVVHGIAYPWRLFQIASGESVLGASLSETYGVDVSRLFPSLIRVNAAAIVWSLLLVLSLFLLVRFEKRIGSALVAISICLLMSAVVIAMRLPGRVVELEDAHVFHSGGSLYPEKWTVARFRFRGGWAMPAGSKVLFRMEPGKARLVYQSSEGAVIAIDGTKRSLPPTSGFAAAALLIESPDVELRVLEGFAVIDRVVHE